MKKVIAIALAACAAVVLFMYRAAIGFGPALLAGIILYGLLWRCVTDYGYMGRTHKRLRYLSYIMTAAFVLWLISFVIIEYNVVTKGEHGSADQGSYVIVLGAGLKGEEPSVSLSSRLKTASEYLEEHRDIKAVVSGGQGQGESMSEAEAMKSYLIGRGIEEERIIMEGKSTSTKENLLFSKKILDDLEGRASYDIVVITSDYHVFRTEIIARRMGMEVSVLPAETPLYVYINGCIREYFAVVHTYLFN